MEKWQKGLVLDEGAQAAQAQAEEVACRTRELLTTQGWCLWKCSTLGGDIIVVVLDENFEGVPGGYPVYTMAELEELCWDSLHICSEKGKGVGEATLRLVHEAKRRAGAIVVTVEDSMHITMHTLFPSFSAGFPKEADGRWQEKLK